jgi:hypothetical protein
MVSVDEKETDGSRLKEWSRVVPYWFAGIAALIYGTGYIVEFTFLNSFNIREANTDPFKAKYIYLGVLSLQFPASVGIAILGYVRSVRQALGESDQALSRWHRLHRKIKAFCCAAQLGYLAGELTLLNLLFLFYFLVAFSDPGFFATNQFWIFVSIVCTPITMIVIREWETSGPSKRPSRKSAIARWIVLLVLVGINIWVLRRDFDLLLEITLGGGWLHITLISVVGLLVYWLEKHRERSNAELAVSFCLIATFAYLSILIFAYRVYPYIPVQRAGGDFSRRPRISRITFKSEMLKSIPEALLQPNLELITDPDLLDATTTVSKPLVVISESPTTLVVTVPESIDPARNDPSGPVIALQAELQQWRKIGPDNKPKEIFTLNREAVVTISSKAE